MSLRESRPKRADGSLLSHLQLAEKVWDAERGRARVKIIHIGGRADDPVNTERLRRLAHSILRAAARPKRSSPRTRPDGSLRPSATRIRAPHQEEGHPRIDQANVDVLATLDGKFVVHSNDDTLSAADLALGYKPLQRVELAWRQLKSGLTLRPVYHWALHRIHACVALTVLALLLVRIAEAACADSWGNIRDDLKQIKLAQLSSRNGTVWQVSGPSPETLKHLKSLKILESPPVLKLA